MVANTMKGHMPLREGRLSRLHTYEGFKERSLASAVLEGCPAIHPVLQLACWLVAPESGHHLCCSCNQGVTISY